MFNRVVVGAIKLLRVDDDADCDDNDDKMFSLVAIYVG